MVLVDSFSRSALMMREIANEAQLVTTGILGEFDADRYANLDGDSLSSYDRRERRSWRLHHIRIIDACMHRKY